MEINTEKLNAGEIELLQWQYGGQMGNFKTHLWGCISNADNTNLGLLSKAFPQQIKAYQAFIAEHGYWEGLLVRAGLLKPLQPANEPPPAEPPGKPLDS